MTILFQRFSFEHCCKDEHASDYSKRKTSVLIGHSDGCFHSQETTPRRAIGRRGWSRLRSPGGEAGGRSVTRQPLLPGHLCSWHNAPASPCHRTPSTVGYADTRDKYLSHVEFTNCILQSFLIIMKLSWGRVRLFRKCTTKLSGFECRVSCAIQFQETGSPEW